MSDTQSTEDPSHAVILSAVHALSSSVHEMTTQLRANTDRLDDMEKSIIEIRTDQKDTTKYINEQRGALKFGKYFIGILLASGASVAAWIGLIKHDW